VEKQSGVVSEQLSEIDSPLTIPAYKNVQSCERNLANTNAALHIAANIVSSAQADMKQDLLVLQKLNDAAVAMCRQYGITTVESYVVVDSGDPIGLGHRLVIEMGKLPSGQPLVKMIRTATHRAESAQQAFHKATKERDAASVRVTSAILRLRAAIAEGQAVLNGMGIKLNRKPAPRRSPVAPTANAPALTVVPTPAPITTPPPAANGDEEVAPTPAVPVGAVG
jgi:hypothetical protein